jgi:hypothetical protein
VGKPLPIAVDSAPGTTEANPAKSDRAIATDIDVSTPTVFDVFGATITLSRPIVGDIDLADLFADTIHQGMMTVSAIKLVFLDAVSQPAQYIRSQLIHCRIIRAFKLHFHIALQMRDNTIISIITITITIIHRHALPWTSVD